MAQKDPPVRGRPRRYDPDVALARATEVFREKGFAGTTLDELGEAMGMNRPSIHAAFGDKAALFMTALERYEAEGETALRAALDPQLPLRPALKHLFAMMADRFSTADEGPGGCLLFSVAATETHTPAVRLIVSGATCSLEDAFRVRFTAAVEAGEVAASSNPSEMAMLASGLVHSLSTRARAGETEEALCRVINVFVNVMCGPAP